MKKILKIVSSIFLILGASSCHRVTGNQLDFEICDYEIVGESIEAIKLNGKKIIINCSNNTYYYDNSYDDIKATELQSRIVVYGGNAPRYGFYIEDDYKGIEKYLLNYNELNSEISVIYTEGYLFDNYVYGICNVYYDTVGYLSGGGNYAEEEIAYSIYYKYDNKLDEMTTICKIEEKMIVAFSYNKIIYWENKSLYSYDISLDTSNYLCDDLSYCSGIRHQSVGTIFFNKDFALFNFIEGKRLYDVDNMYIYSFKDDKCVKLKYLDYSA